MLLNLIKKFVPDEIKKRYKSYKSEQVKNRISKLHKFSEIEFKNLIINDLTIRESDLVFIHSSVDKLNLDFPFYKIINILLDIVGSNGTIIFPTYPQITSYKFLLSGQVFDIQKTPAYTGLLNEFARRYKGSVRSLHPTKSVVAIGKYAKEITSTHHESIYPYDFSSPYYKISEYNGKIIGLGVKTTYLSAVHVIDDTMKDKFPVFPFHDKIFEAKCIDYNRKEVIVKTYAHDMAKMGFDLPEYFAKYINKDVCEDKNIHGMNFFIAKSNPLFKEMTKLVEEKNITIYSKKYYKK